MTKLRVLVVEDSLTVRKRLCEILSADPEIEVIAEAADGKHAIELCLSLKPDVVSLDMMLPVMTGLSATEYIMAHAPTPILIVSASINRAELFKTYDALAAGAVDVLEKLRDGVDDDAWSQQYRNALKLVAKIKVITHPRARLHAFPRHGSDAMASIPAVLRAQGADHSAIEIVAIGASTGGPGAILDVLNALPELPVPLLFVLHIDEPFGKAFANWLATQTRFPVSFAQDGELLEGLRGRVVMAPPAHHLVVQKRRLRLHDGPMRHSCRPSIDVLFESLAEECGESVVATLLTGMGRDGANGLLEIRKKGGITFAQDEATSVVYGMPREAAALGAAIKILPLHQIGQTIAETLARGGKR